MHDVEGCIKNKAYKLWEKDGCKQGQDLDYWLIAEQTVKSADEKTAVPKLEYWKQGGGWHNTYSLEAKNQCFHRHVDRT